MKNRGPLDAHRGQRLLRLSTPGRRVHSRQGLTRLSLALVVTGVLLGGAASCTGVAKRAAAGPSPGAAAVPASSLAVVVGVPLQWSIDLAGDLHLQQRVCRQDGAPVTEAERVAPVDPRARRFATPLTVVDGCWVNTIDLKAMADALGARAAADRVADDVVMASPDVWLWTPTPARAGTLTLTAAPGLQISLPFPRTPDGGGFVVEPSTWRFLSCAAFGRLQTRRLAVGTAALEVLVLPGDTEMVGADVDRWLGAAATAVSLGSGRERRFPFNRTQITVEPVWGSGVPFGMVSRGGGPQAHLLLGQQARVQDVIDSWVAVHELSHLLHPLMDLDDSWFGEGFASYHQNVLRARAGLMSEADAWTALTDGLRRGAEASARGPWTVSLQDASVQMRAEGRYLQVYWGGAAVVLWMDVALRQCADRSIDDVVATFRAEQPDVDQRRVPARAIVARAAGMAPACAHIAADVDALLRQPFLGDSLPALLHDLGIDEGTLSPSAPRAGVREAITRPILSVR